MGLVLKAMVLNGLGFANRRLYLMPEFFRNKPAADSVLESTGYHLEEALAARVAARERCFVRRSCFVVATNELDDAERAK